MESSSPHATPHGQKRQHDDELEHAQRLTKRFNLLNLEQNASKLYIPVKAETTTNVPPTAPRRRRSNAVSETMPVDETKDRVYIHDLEEELADIESDEERLIFLPDIEKHLMKVPKAVLTGESQSSSQGTEMVLYKLPESLSVSEDRDGVRKAIAEARARAQERAMQQDRERALTEGLSSFASAVDDENAMDLE